MKPWWYFAAMYGAYLLFMSTVRWLGNKVGPRLPARWQPLLTTPTGTSRIGKKVFLIGLALTLAFYAVIILAARHGAHS